MDITHASRWRNLAGRACALFCFILFLVVLDGLVAKFREPVNVLHVLPGNETEINGNLPKTITDLKELRVSSDSPLLTVKMEVLHSGYFLGGNMWRGHLLVDPTIPPGKYTLVVHFPKNLADTPPPPPYRVVVHPDALSLQKSSKSLIKSTTGYSPWFVVTAFLPLVVLSGGVVFFLSRRIDSLMAEQGRAEIYRMTRGEGIVLIAFGLGREHGLQPGDRVVIHDPQGGLVGTAEVKEATAIDSVALASADQGIKPGYIVSPER